MSSQSIITAKTGNLGKIPKEWKATIKTGEIHCGECGGDAFKARLKSSLMLTCLRCGSRTLVSFAAVNLPKRLVKKNLKA